MSSCFAKGGIKEKIIEVLKEHKHLIGLKIYAHLVLRDTFSDFNLFCECLADLAKDNYIELEYNGEYTLKCDKYKPIIDTKPLYEALDKLKYFDSLDLSKYHFKLPEGQLLCPSDNLLDNWRFIGLTNSWFFKNKVWEDKSLNDNKLG